MYPGAIAGRLAALAAEKALLCGPAWFPAKRRGGGWRTRRTSQRCGLRRMRRSLRPSTPCAYDPLLGRTYADIGSDAHSNHKCQAWADSAAGPGARRRRPGRRCAGAAAAGAERLPRRYRDGWLAADAVTHWSIRSLAKCRSRNRLFDGIDTSLTAIAQYAGPNPPRALTAGAGRNSGMRKAAQKAFADGNDAATAAPVEAGLAALRALASSSARWAQRFRALRNRISA